MKLSPYLPQYATWADEYLNPLGFSRESISLGVDAWAIAHKTGIYRHALSTSSEIVDAHVQTALKSLFPNVKFSDKKVY